MPRKFLPRYIEGGPEIETEIREQLAIEKFKNEIALQQCRAQRYQQRFQSLDSEMVAHITAKFKEEVSQRLTRKWEIDCKEQEEISVEIFENKKEDWIEEKVTTGFRNDPANKNKELCGGPRKIREGISNKEEEGRFFREYGEDRSRGNRNQSEGRQDNGRRQRARSQSRGRRPRRNNNNGQRDGSRIQQNFVNTRSQAFVNLPARSEAFDRNNQETVQQQDTVVIPETQTDQVAGKQSGGNANQSMQRGEGNIFLFHAQGSTNTDPNNNQH